MSEPRECTVNFIADVCIGVGKVFNNTDGRITVESIPMIEKSAYDALKAERDELLKSEKIWQDKWGVAGTERDWFEERNAWQMRALNAEGVVDALEARVKSLGIYSCAAENERLATLLNQNKQLLEADNKYIKRLECELAEAKDLLREFVEHFRYPCIAKSLEGQMALVGRAKRLLRK